MRLLEILNLRLHIKPGIVPGIVKNAGSYKGLCLSSSSSSSLLSVRCEFLKYPWRHMLDFKST